MTRCILLCNPSQQGRAARVCAILRHNGHIVAPLLLTADDRAQMNAGLRKARIVVLLLPLDEGDLASAALEEARTAGALTATLTLDRSALPDVRLSHLPDAYLTGLPALMRLLSLVDISSAVPPRHRVRLSQAIVGVLAAILTGLALLVTIFTQSRPDDAVVAALPTRHMLQQPAEYPTPSPLALADLSTIETAIPTVTLTSSTHTVTATGLSSVTNSPTEESTAVPSAPVTLTPADTVFSPVVTTAVAPTVTVRIAPPTPTRTIDYNAPIASFSADQTSGTAPLQVTFRDDSLGAIASYAWDFNGDGTVDSTQANPPPYTYTQPGTFPVSLTVTGTSGMRERTQALILVFEAEAETLDTIPDARFSADPLDGTAPLTVSFTNQSTGEVLRHIWDFNNDGRPDSAQPNPQHTYTEPGTYTAALRVLGSGGISTPVTAFITVRQNTVTATLTPSASATLLAATATSVPSVTMTLVPRLTASPTATPSPSATATQAVEATEEILFDTPTQTQSPTSTFTPSPTGTYTPTPTTTFTPSPTNTYTPAPDVIENSAESTAEAAD